MRSARFEPADGTGDLHGTRGTQHRHHRREPGGRNERETAYLAVCSHHGFGTPRPWPVCSLYCREQDQAANATTPADSRRPRATENDARQQENEQLKAAQLRNDGFLVRKDEDTTLQLNNLMKDLQKD